MNIVVYGAGGVGGYFGGKLAKGGFEVTFMARDKTLQAIKSNGLKVKSILGDFVAHPKVTDDISQIIHEIHMGARIFRVLFFQDKEAVGESDAHQKAVRS